MLTHVPGVRCRAICSLSSDNRGVAHDLRHHRILPSTSYQMRLSEARSRGAPTSRFVNPPPSPPALPANSPWLSHRFHSPSFLARFWRSKRTGGIDCHRFSGSRES